MFVQTHSPCSPPSQSLSIRSSTSPTCNICTDARVDGHKMRRIYYNCNCAGLLCQVKFSKKQCRKNEKVFQWAVSPGDHAVMPEGIEPPLPKLSDQAKAFIRQHLDSKMPLQMHAELLALDLQCELRQIQNFAYQERKKLCNDGVAECTTLEKS